VRDEREATGGSPAPGERLAPADAWDFPKRTQISEAFKTGCLFTEHKRGLSFFPGGSTQFIDLIPT
jgi:hypothetical protein